MVFGISTARRPRARLPPSSSPERQSHVGLSIIFGRASARRRDTCSWRASGETLTSKRKSAGFIGEEGAYVRESGAGPTGPDRRPRTRRRRGSRETRGKDGGTRLRDKLARLRLGARGLKKRSSERVFGLTSVKISYGTRAAEDSHRPVLWSDDCSGELAVGGCEPRLARGRKPRARRTLSVCWSALKGRRCRVSELVERPTLWARVQAVHLLPPNRRRILGLSPRPSFEERGSRQRHLPPRDRWKPRGEPSGCVACHRLPSCGTMASSRGASPPGPSAPRCSSPSDRGTL